MEYFSLLPKTLITDEFSCSNLSMSVGHRAPILTTQGKFFSWIWSDGNKSLPSKISSSPPHILDEEAYSQWLKQTSPDFIYPGSRLNQGDWISVYPPTAPVRVQPLSLVGFGYYICDKIIAEEAACSKLLFNATNTNIEGYVLIEPLNPLAATRPKQPTAPSSDIITKKIFGSIFDDSSGDKRRTIADFILELGSTNGHGMIGFPGSNVVLFSSKFMDIVAKKADLLSHYDVEGYTITRERYCNAARKL